MSDLLKLSEHDHAAVIQQIAELLLKANPINLDEIIVIPTATVAQCTGLSPKSVQRKFPITALSKQKQGGDSENPPGIHGEEHSTALSVNSFFPPPPASGIQTECNAD